MSYKKHSRKNKILKKRNNRNYTRRSNKQFHIRLSIHGFLHNWKSKIRISDLSDKYRNKHSSFRTRKTQHKNRNKTDCRMYSLYNDNKKIRTQSFRRKNRDNSVMFRTDRCHHSSGNKYIRRYLHRTNRGTGRR